MTAAAVPARRDLLVRWRSLSGRARLALGVVLVIVGVNVVLALVDQVAGTAPSGPAGSSYATAPGGTAAWADLLARNGHPVTRFRHALDAQPLDPATTVAVIDPAGLRDREADALTAFLRAGGRAVLAGAGTAPAMRRMLGDGPVWQPQGTEIVQVVLPVPELASGEPLVAAGDGSWRTTGAALPVAGGEDRTVVAVADVGAGRLVLVADPQPLTNDLLAARGNAAFALAVVGEPGRPVVFDEAVHGYGGAGRGLRAVPARWRLGLLLSGLATLVWMWGRGRRLGPAAEDAVALLPPRIAHVQAVAAALARTGRPDAAVAPLRRAGRAALARRGGLGPDPADDQLRLAARSLDMPSDAASALLGSGEGADPVTVARAAAWLEGSPW